MIESTENPHPSKEVSQKSSLHDIRGILEERGISAESYKGMVVQKGTLEGFFSDSKISPESQLGQYIRVRVAEEDAIKALTAQINRKKRSEKSIEVLKERLGIVRGVRKEIGTEIFGDKQDEFVAPLEKTLFKQSPLSSSDRRHRTETRQQLVEEISKQFPQAEK